MKNKIEKYLFRAAFCLMIWAGIVGFLLLATWIDTI